ncbi:MAG TPA: CoA transferase [Burkholderiaceae bacterium]|nr:CoA transferase [Burkholderiaceae bacterium]
MSGPLTGVRIIDFTGVMMGPYATQMLADYGAEVIKIESPDGDSMRHAGPTRSPGMGPMYLHANHNKKSVAIDLKQPRGKEVLLQLLQDAHVFVSNVRPSALARLGFGYEELAQRFPRLIYVSGCGFGSNGRYAGRPAYDDLIQGLAALPTLALRAGTEEPVYTPSVIADRVTGLHVALAITSALYSQQQSGRGQYVEVPMFECLAHLVLGDHFGGRTHQPPTGPMGYSRLLTPNRRPYRTEDGYVCVVVYTDQHWKAFLTLIGQAALLESDPRFASPAARFQNIDQLYAIVAEAMLTKTSAEWLEVLAKADIPAGPLHSPESLLDDPHLNDAGFFEVLEHPTEGTIYRMRTPTRWSETAPEYRSPAPRLGEHSRSVLQEAGVARSLLDTLERDGVIKTAPVSNHAADRSQLVEAPSQVIESAGVTARVAASIG